MGTEATLTTTTWRCDEARDLGRDGRATWKQRGSAESRREVAATSAAPRETSYLQRICHSQQQGATPPRVDGKEGVAGSSPAEGS